MKKERIKWEKLEGFGLLLLFTIVLTVSICHVIIKDTVRELELQPGNMIENINAINQRIDEELITREEYEQLTNDINEMTSHTKEILDYLGGN